MYRTIIQSIQSEVVEWNNTKQAHAYPNLTINAININNPRIQFSASNSSNPKFNGNQHNDRKRPFIQSTSTTSSSSSSSNPSPAKRAHTETNQSQSTTAPQTNNNEMDVIHSPAINKSITPSPSPVSLSESPSSSSSSSMTIDNELTPSSWRLVSYIISLNDVPGKFDINRAKALGVPPGPLYAQLKAGQSVSYTCKKTGEQKSATSNECVLPSTPGARIGVIDCMNVDCIRYLTEDNTWNQYQPFQTTNNSNNNSSTPSSSSSTRHLSVIVHIAPMSVVTHNDYRSFMFSFGPSTRHIIVNNYLCSSHSVFRCSTLNYFKLAHIAPSLFHAARDDESDTSNIKQLTLHNRKKENEVEEAVMTLTYQGTEFTFPSSTAIGECLLRFVLLPPVSMGFDSEFILKKITNNEIDDAIKQIQEKSNAKTMNTNGDNDEDSTNDTAFTDVTNSSSPSPSGSLASSSSSTAIESDTLKDDSKSLTTSFDCDVECDESHQREQLQKMWNEKFSTKPAPTGHINFVPTEDILEKFAVTYIDIVSLSHTVQLTVFVLICFTVSSIISLSVISFSWYRFSDSLYLSKCYLYILQSWLCIITTNTSITINIILEY
jgi:hypothetical protein